MRLGKNVVLFGFISELLVLACISIPLPCCALPWKREITGVSDCRHVIPLPLHSTNPQYL